MDEADRAQIEIDHALLSYVAAARSRSEIQPVGECLNCGRTLGSGGRWCDANCRDDWARLHSTRPMPRVQRVRVV